MHHWLKEVIDLSTAHADANGDPTLTEIDSLLKKGDAANGLNPRDTLRLSILITQLSWNETAANVRLNRLRQQQAKR